MIMIILCAETGGDNADTAAANTDDSGGADKPEPDGPPAPSPPALPIHAGGDQSNAHLSKDESESLQYAGSCRQCRRQPEQVPIIYL